MAIREENAADRDRLIAGSAFPKEVLTLEGMLRLADRLRADSDPEIQGRWFVFKHRWPDGSETTLIGGSKD
ncbi:MAG TPA: hypothetical protein VF535_16760 [Allosphingosinicella sp.]